MCPSRSWASSFCTRTPHLPHGWETGYLADETRAVLRDLFTQPVRGEIALVTSDLVGAALIRELARRVGA
ncbi:MAG TPA: hypothetical protein VEK11_17510 [Thermoanaerobaculia bacterium]|nr:hypothetical protein [Thermoanaerobaculia bacterium]